MVTLQGYGYVPGEGNWKFNPIHGDDLATFMVDTLVNHETLQQGVQLEVGGFSKCFLGYLNKGPETFSMNDVIRLGYKVTRRQTTTITRVPGWLRSTSTVKPFFDNVTSLLSAHDKLDCIGKPVGSRHLQDILTDIYMGKLSVTVMCK
jgi:hypothetical protein